MKNIAFFILIVISLPAFAEYRVYQYLIKSKNLTHQVSTGDAQMEISTFDPQTFIRYHGGHSAIDVHYKELGCAKDILVKEWTIVLTLQRGLHFED